MATSLTIQSGPLTATKSTNNDTAAQTALLRFAHGTGADPSWTNQQKLDHVAKELVAYIVRAGREQYINEETAAIREAAKTEVGF